MNRFINFSADTVWRFARFTFDPQQRLVTEAGRPLVLGGRALEILQVLLEHAGGYVGKDTLIRRVWPSSVVEDINLRVHIAALRRALGDGRNGQRYIVNNPRRGYCFAVPVSQARRGAAPAESHPRGRTRHNLPTRLTPVIGRDQLLGRLRRELLQNRLMTLSGAAGIGKSTLALRVAEGLVDHYHDGAWVVDVSGVDEPEHLLQHISAVLELDSSELDALCAYLAPRQLLLVLDGCEHPLDACRALLEVLLEVAPHVTVLLSSREALQLPGETVHCLPALAVPALAVPCGLSETLACPAVQLFVARARAGQQGFNLREQDLSAVSDICRRLDGIPLALELAAAQVDALGLAGVQAQLDNGLRLLSKGRRTAAGRHQSLRAALDWSYQRLSPQEQRVLGSLVVFKEPFSLEAAVAVTGCDLPGSSERRELIGRLAAKSLLWVEQTQGGTRFRLFNTTRSYVLEKLAQRKPSPNVNRP